MTRSVVLAAGGTGGHMFPALALGRALRGRGLAVVLACDRRGARYVGALGSRKTHQRRVAKLREAGVPDAQIERLHNPIGLDLGGRRAEEIALAVMAQIVAVSHGLDARPP